MNEVDVVNIDNVVKLFGDKILSDKDFTKSDLLNATVSKPVEISDVSFSFGASGNFNIQLFNSSDDQDSDKIIGDIIDIKSDEAWLKYQITSNLKSTVGLDLSASGFDIAFGIDGQKSLTFTGYRLHKDFNQKLQDAVLADFKPYLFIANPNHLLNLVPGELLSVELPGKLNLNLSVNWSDIFTGSLSLFESLLGPNQIFSLEIGPSISVDFSIDVQDNFSLQIRRIEEDQFDVFFHKSLSKEISGGFAASISAGFKDPDAVKKVLGTVTESLISDLKGKIQPILDKNPIKQLTDTEKAIVLKVAQLLGFDASLINTVADFIKSLDDKVGKVIKDIATSKIKFGFAYEYNRTSSVDTILQATLNKDALQKYHSTLVRFKLESFDNKPCLLTDLQVADDSGISLPGVVLKNYLKETTIKRSQSWGFSLGLGKWSIGGKDNKNISEIVRENLQKRKQIAFEGVRGYDGKLINFEHGWEVDFNAEMDRFSQNAMPLASELNYSLFLLSTWKKPKIFGADTLGDIVDQAVLWKIISQSQFDAVKNQLVSSLTGNDVSEVEVSIHLKINEFTFRTILTNIAFLIQHKPLENAAQMAVSLAAAMTHMKDFNVRATIAARINAYAPLWQACLLSPDNKHENNNTVGSDERDSLSFLAQTQMINLGENLLAAQEIDPTFRNSSSSNLFSSTLTMNPNVRVDWSLFRNGVVNLINAFNQGLIYDNVVKKSFQNMQGFWSEEHYVRALGHYLLNFANNSFLMEGVDRSLTVTYKKKGEPKSINLIGKL